MDKAVNLHYAFINISNGVLALFSITSFYKIVSYDKWDPVIN